MHGRENGVIGIEISWVNPYPLTDSRGGVPITTGARHVEPSQRSFAVSELTASADLSRILDESLGQ